MLNEEKGGRVASERREPEEWLGGPAVIGLKGGEMEVHKLDAGEKIKEGGGGGGGG